MEQGMQKTPTTIIFLKIYSFQNQMKFQFELNINHYHKRPDLKNIQFYK